MSTSVNGSFVAVRRKRARSVFFSTYAVESERVEEEADASDERRVGEEAEARESSREHEWMSRRHE
jgi:hypothetical protein